MLCLYSICLMFISFVTTTSSRHMFHSNMFNDSAGRFFRDCCNMTSYYACLQFRQSLYPSFIDVLSVIVVSQLVEITEKSSFLGLQPEVTWITVWRVRNISIRKTSRTYQIISKFSMKQFLHLPGNMMCFIILPTSVRVVYLLNS